MAAPTREDLYTALRNADQAGDTAGAQKLAAYIQSLPSEAPAAPPMTSGQEWAQAGKNVGSAIVRPIVKGVASLPLMAMDTGVAAKNLVSSLAHGYRPTLSDFNPFAASKTGPAPPWETELPSTTFNRGLDQLTVAPEGRANRVGEFVSSALVGSRVPAPQAAQQAPSGFVPPAQALRDAALARAQREGYVVPPSSNNPTFANRLMEGVAGKAKLTQEAMMRNQPTTEGLAARALGQNPEVPITQGALATIRSEAQAAGYDPVRAMGQITPDLKFQVDLSTITKAGQGAARMGIKAPNTTVDGILDALKNNKSFDASDGIDSIQYLRTLADDAFSSGSNSVGREYKAAAKAIEDVIERNLAAKGEDAAGILNGYRGARQLIAQTYTAGKALTDDVGTTSALKYAGELRNGAPLVGDQRTIGQFASQFGKFAKPPQEIYPSISPLDTYGAAITSGLTGSAAPLMLPLTRMGLREYLLSSAGQARAMPKAFAPQQTMGLLGAYPQSATGP